MVQITLMRRLILSEPECRCSGHLQEVVAQLSCNDDLPVLLLQRYGGVPYVF